MNGKVLKREDGGEGIAIEVARDPPWCTRLDELESHHTYEVRMREREKRASEGRAGEGRFNAMLARVSSTSSCGVDPSTRKSFSSPTKGKSVTEFSPIIRK